MTSSVDYLCIDLGGARSCRYRFRLSSDALGLPFASFASFALLATDKTDGTPMSLIRVSGA